MISKFLALPKEEQEILITNTADKMKLSLAIVEKDFWVCFMLEYLFTSFKYKDLICFKGGTSLSKIYHCIERFSEDIDLAVDWSVLGLEREDAYANRSNRQQEFFNKNANLKMEQYLKDVWLPLMRKDLRILLQQDFDLYIDDNDSQTICFQYPKVYDDLSILQIIRLEIGALAEPIPADFKSMRPYIAECYPYLFNNDEITVRVVDVCRTFYEKITILHREVHRTNGNYPSRYSRHFYDIYQMIEKGVADHALEQLELIPMVVKFKKKFYSCNWAKYDEVLEGKCKLIPTHQALEVFNKDYELMKNMIYGDYPSFDDIILKLTNFEKKLNAAIEVSFNQ